MVKACEPRLQLPCYKDFIVVRIDKRVRMGISWFAKTLMNIAYPPEPFIAETRSQLGIAKISSLSVHESYMFIDMSSALRLCMARAQDHIFFTQDLIVCPYF